MLQNKFNLDFINEIPKISALQEAWLLSGTPSHSCGARRMADSAAHLVDEVLPKRPIRQWVLSVPFPLRYLFATNPPSDGPRVDHHASRDQHLFD